MVFSSIYFTFLFLPILIVLYYLPVFKNNTRADIQYKNSILLIFSFVFYTYGNYKYVWVLILLISFNWASGRVISKSDRSKKSILFLTVLIDALILCFFKYAAYLLSIILRGSGIGNLHIELPIGISFFTFQCISYVIDVYRDDVDAQRNVLDFALYISFFPQLIAGPIVRYKDIKEYIYNRYVSLDKFGSGAKRFIIGFSKKIIIANNLSVLVDSVYSIDYLNITNSSLLFWLGTIAYTLQIYYDFSGYSDMAIGLGRMFGFEICENFNYPYISKSMTELWNRWHISLGTWFKDYVYIPLGGNRKHIVRNLVIVWFLTGLWHGANNYTFLIWGV